MSFADLRARLARVRPEIAALPDKFVRRKLGLSDSDDRIRPLFTSYQMRAFEEDEYPYKVRESDPQDVQRWQS